VVEKGIWRIRTNQEFRELCSFLDVLADIKKKLEGIRYLVRMDYGMAGKKIFESQLE
jgi:hypothetical protein